MGYAGVYLFFLFLLQNIDCGYSLEPPRRGGSNVYPQSMFWAKIRKISTFYGEIFNFWYWKKSLYIAWASFRNEIVNYSLFCSIWCLVIQPNCLPTTNGHSQVINQIVLNYKAIHPIRCAMLIKCFMLYISYFNHGSRHWLSPNRATLL